MKNPLENIVGQEKVKLTLEKIISSGRISHAFLFKGLDGVGKENTAFRFAESLIYYTNLNEEKKKYLIHQLQKLSEPFIKYIFPLPRGKNETDEDNPYDKLKEDELELIQDELSKKSENPYYKLQISRANIIKINSIRNINHFVAMSFEESVKRIILISDAHLMNEASQNALLKNLEEPPENIIFILCTNYPERLKETIRSRCWEINFQPLEKEDLIKILTEYFQIDSATAIKVADFSNGSVSQALKILEYGLDEIKEKIIRILRFSFGKKFYSAFKEFEETDYTVNQEYLEIIIRFLIHWVNDFIKYKSNYPEIHFHDYSETFQKFYSRYPDLDLLPLTNKLDEISSRLKNNINTNLALSNIISEISSVIPTK